MKWIFLVNNAPYLMEFLGKLAYQAIEEDECIVAINSKIAEYGKKKFFPDRAKFVSKIDWCIGNYQKDKKEFGDLSWRELFLAFDRFKRLDFGYDNSLDMVSQLYQFFEALFGKEKPDVVVSEPPAGLFHEVAYYFCQVNNIPYIGLAASRFKGRIDIYNLETTCSKYKETFTEINDSDISEQERQFVKNFIEEFVSHRQLPSYSRSSKIYFSQFGLIKHFIKRTKEVGGSRFRYLLNRKDFRRFDYESENIFKNSFYAPWKAQKRKFRILFQKNLFKSLSKNDKNFFLFPLHFQPEASTSVLATYFCDQLNTIKNIAFTLPFPYKLYVKEHPAAVGTKPRSFYKRLEQLPNVVLISAYENAENLIKKSSGVITLTSTIGMEAALANKPVYVLGNVFYSYHPLCRKVKNFDELKDKIREDLINKPNTDNLEDINHRFIASCFRNTIKGDMLLASEEKDTNDYKLIYQNIIKFLK